MAREIKFRAWDKDREEMLYEGWTGKPQFFVNMGVWQFAPEPSKLHMMDKKLNFEAMQYTGLKDKNGKEIYEADIIFLELDNENAVVVFEDGEFGVLWHDEGFFTPIKEVVEFEVIGNIYEDGGLL